ncbi:hypothetical protein POM88_013346 [Heracleum sosnowskyi]|uniref:Protein kinase domain-containing protein n=1 Tax=Heracleum sosnowskyi TaxID=360622 RepID=A0AAD8MY07_9APIA|nr:hypothetical protein POM88_013346 [Heracleum sosnowskyi]
MKGTIGYAAPEYGMGSDISIQGDVYSFGILLLELFTGRRPTDEVFRDGMNLHNFVNMAVGDQVMVVVDQSALYREEGITKEAGDIGTLRMDMRQFEVYKHHCHFHAILRFSNEAFFDEPATDAFTTFLCHLCATS